ncbi:hypothetical protein AB0436_14415 [Streptomyces sp. NPDC051322]|uniref:hypothetical protein n=1 Tax=Streptomyces sp. NPDC051322 TaxID=3154645 RepID=UPI003450D564
MSRTSLLSVTACAMCPTAAPTERDRAMAGGGAPAGQGYHVALHTPSAFTPVGYHPTALLIGAGSSDNGWYPAGIIPAPSRSEESGHGDSVRPPDGNGRPTPGQHHLIPGSRSPVTPNEVGSAGLPPTGTGPGTGPDAAELTGITPPASGTLLTPTRRRTTVDAPAVMNNASTWHAPEYVRISGERCWYRPWSSTGTGLTTAAGELLEAAAFVPRSHLKDSDSPVVVEDPAVVRQFTPAPRPRSAAQSVRDAESPRRLPAPASAEPVPRSPHEPTRTRSSVVRYAAGGALLLVIAAVLARRRPRH